MERITMEDVYNKIDSIKGELERALQRRGLARVRLNEAAKQLELAALSLREHPTQDVSFPFSVRSLQEDYEREQKAVSECASDLLLLRVPKAEIEKLLR
jgi:chromosome segregation ATPase